MLRSLLAGQDGPHQRALPAGEFLHPVPLAALILLAANDWWLKPSGWATGVLTGKLSDFAGLLFFPLLLTSLLDCLLLGLARRGLHVDFSLRRGKLVASIVLTGLLFSLLKLHPESNALALRLASGLGLQANIVMDATDLVALPVLWLSYRIGRAEIARCPLGRIEYILRNQHRGVVVPHALHDMLWAGADPTSQAQLVEGLEAFMQSDSKDNAQRVVRSLAQLRNLSPIGP